MKFKCVDCGAEKELVDPINHIWYFIVRLFVKKDRIVCNRCWHENN